MATARRILLVRIRSGLDQDQASVGSERDLSGGAGAWRDAGQVRSADAPDDQFGLMPVPPESEQRGCLRAASVRGRCALASAERIAPR